MSRSILELSGQSLVEYSEIFEAIILYKAMEERGLHVDPSWSIQYGYLWNFLEQVLDDFEPGEGKFFIHAQLSKKSIREIKKFIESERFCCETQGGGPTFEFKKEGIIVNIDESFFIYPLMDDFIGLSRLIREHRIKKECA